MYADNKEYWETRLEGWEEQVWELCQHTGAETLDELMHHVFEETHWEEIFCSPMDCLDHVRRELWSEYVESTR